MLLRAFEVRAGFGKPPGVERRESGAHLGVEFVVRHGAPHARQTLGGGHVAGIALEHVGKQRLRLGPVLGVFGVLRIGERRHHAACGGDLGEPFGGLVIARARS